MTRYDHVLDKSHGQTSFDRSIAPVLTITPGTGETIAMQTDGELFVQLHERGSLEAVTAPINPVTGPIYVDGAEPGDALRVTIHDIVLGDHGWSVYLPGAGALTERMGDELFSRKIPLTNDAARLTESITAKLRPMIGCIGTAPAGEPGSTVMPSFGSGGNMDLTDASPGSIVYLPVEVSGGLLSLGDIHAVMARGESSFVAIEAEGTAVISIDLVKGANLRAPRVETESEWCFIGIGDPVQDSIKRGYEDCFDFLLEAGYSREDAYVVMSALVHSELGGPTGSKTPDPLHPFTAIGAVTVHRLPKELVD
ncbi:acetamidase/formamidase family protein [Bowdeniella massiliensis]|uniref:acetamidase/formamidase family protein n=1 Tax=Bowdeniella massiliensis TaxID=2932264 RepID=UPI002028E5E3|nr:acetamidase/formamidase family protein [Bowdeniella massiliensis]